MFPEPLTRFLLQNICLKTAPLLLKKSIHKFPLYIDFYQDLPPPQIIFFIIILLREINLRVPFREKTPDNALPCTLRQRGYEMLRCEASHSTLRRPHQRQELVHFLMPFWKNTPTSFLFSRLLFICS